MGSRRDEQNNLERQICILKEKIDQIRAEKEEFAQDCQRFNKKNSLKVNASIRKTSRQLEKITKIVEGHKDFLNQVKKTNENAEETLCNVLLAIRQNEYLQAWYPAQSGFPEMKVTGKHPKNIEKMKEKQNVDSVVV